jgi:hypothetical protein
MASKSMELVLSAIKIYDILITVTNSLTHIAYGNNFSGSMIYFYGLAYYLILPSDKNHTLSLSVSNSFGHI